MTNPTKFVDRWGESHTVEVVRNGETFDVIADGVKVFDELIGGADEEQYAVSEVKFFCDLVQPTK